MGSEQALVGGRYQLAEPLGQGGMATVRRGFDTRLGRPVAVKQLVSSLAADPICQERFKREARSAASLSHPAIVAVLDTGEEPDPRTGLSIPYLVMELVEGQTLRSVLRDTPKVLPQRALELTRDVLEALSHSHDSGIVHRDIKPANVMVTSTGVVKVMDFGIARAISDTSTDFTQTASVVGTAHYLSPEQARGERVGCSSDLYSAGCLLYELLTGRPPFVGESVLSVVYQHVREAPVPPSELDPAIDPEIDAVVLKALAKDPADRYPDARAMKADLERVLAGHQPAAAPAPAVGVGAGSAAAALGADEGDIPTAQVPRVAARDRGRRRWGLALGSVLVGLLTLLGGYGLYRSNEPSPAVAGQLVNVPDVVGSDRAEAVQALQQRQLKARVRTVRGERDQTLNTVVKQFPASGRDAPAGSEVIVEVNAGPVTAKIPSDLEGSDVQDAQDALAALGFRRVTVEVDRSPPADSVEDEVLRVKPGEGETAALTDEVVLRVPGAARSQDDDGSSDQVSDPASDDGDDNTSDAKAQGQTGPDKTSATASSRPSPAAEPTQSEPTQQPSTRPSRSPSTSSSASQQPSKGTSSSAAPQPSTTPTDTKPSTGKPGKDKPGKPDQPGQAKPDKTKPPKP